MFAPGDGGLHRVIEDVNALGNFHRFRKPFAYCNNAGALDTLGSKPNGFALPSEYRRTQLTCEHLVELTARKPLNVGSHTFAPFGE